MNHLHRRTVHKPTVLLTSTLLLSLASCSDYPRIYTVKTEVTSEQEIIRSPELTTVEELRQQNSNPGPKAHTPELIHDFGLMAPLTMGSHLSLIHI
jgi:hypothetical protein